MTPHLSQILRLLRCIDLRPPTEGGRPSTQFIPGRSKFDPFVGGLVATWWYSEHTFAARDAVAAQTMQSSPDFINCDLETVASAVMEVLREICADKRLFKSVSVTQERTLFDCALVSPLALAQAIQTAIADHLRSKIGPRCTVYAAPRIRCASFELEEEGVRLIATTDDAAWERIGDQGYVLHSWSPKRPTIGSHGDTAFSPQAPYECIFASEDVGTPAGTRFNGILKFRKLAALLHALASKTSAGAHLIAQGSPSNFIIQFSHHSILQGETSRGQCSPILPFFSESIEISHDQINTVRDWYEKRRRCSAAFQGRLDKGANFLNRGLNVSDIESFINYFIALDALFGERGSVEASILKGVEALNVEDHLKAKAGWLFDLRNELVHGGSRYLSEWPKYAKYRRHFRTRPLDDVRALAQAAVLGAPALHV